MTRSGHRQELGAPPQLSSGRGTPAGRAHRLGRASLSDHSLANEDTARAAPYFSAVAGYPATPAGKPVVRPGMSTALGSQFLFASSSTIQNATVLDSISRASRSECFMRIMN